MYAEDLIARGQFQTVQVEIDEVIPPNTLKSADKRPIDKTTITFKGKKKALILCKTNESVLRYVTGEGPERWPGSTITLQVRTIKAFGGQTIAIRVIPREGQPIRKSLMDRLGHKAILDTGRPAREDWQDPAPETSGEVLLKEVDPKEQAIRDDWDKAYDAVEAAREAQ